MLGIMKRLWLFSAGVFFIASTLYPQEPALKFHQQNIGISGEVDNLILRDLNNDKLQELIFQQGHNLLIYKLLPAISSTDFSRNAVYQLPEDACIYDIVEAKSNANMVYINSKGISVAGIYSPAGGAGPVGYGAHQAAPTIHFPCQTIFRNERFPAPLQKRILFNLDNDNRMVVVPYNNKFRMVCYDDILSKVITQAEEVPVDMASRIYNSASIFEPLTTEVTFPVFAFADMNNDKSNDFITLRQNNIYGFTCDKENKSVFSFKPVGNLLTIPEGAASQEIDFGYTLSPIVSDINKDGCTDIIFSDDREGTVYIYLNQFNATKTFFAKTPTQIIRTNNWIIEHNLIDLNGDSLDDLVLVQMNKLGVMGGLQAILAKTLEWEIVVYLARPAKDISTEIYPKSPDYVRSIKLPFSFSYSSSLSLGRSLPKIQSPYIWSLAGDFNGDKMRDLLISGTESQIEIYSGIGQQIFDKIAAASPNLSSVNQGYKLMGMPYGAPIIADINNDGRSDIIIPLIRQDSGGIISHSYEILLSN